MSIYATLWTLQFPREGLDYFHDCEWIEVYAQGVPGHIGSSNEPGYEDGDPFADFLPPAIDYEGDEDGRFRAVVSVTSETKKGSARAGQEFVDPLLVLTGEEYEGMSFRDLHQRICDALRGQRPRVVAELLVGDGTVKVLFEDGSSEEVPFGDG
ncbi:MAG TPA: hypothetical protein VNB06_19350 [Thermoanaerobaculia bacterium]|nr:hypothetical protein [Thermoanaerobaculia bacterium]